MNEILIEKIAIGLSFFLIGFSLGNLFQIWLRKGEKENE